MKHLLFLKKKKQKNISPMPGGDARPGLQTDKVFLLLFVHKKKILPLLALALILSACGRKGPPNPPGPPDQIIYPRAYPAR